MKCQDIILVALGIGRGWGANSRRRHRRLLGRRGSGDIILSEAPTTGNASGDDLWALPGYQTQSMSHPRLCLVPSCHPSTRLISKMNFPI